jgi:cellulose synthase/poly-beta-1,6-N-acetylglucosamine synthase-like glycosyltransferase
LIKAHERGAPANQRPHRFRAGQAISVCIPARDEAAVIGRLVESLLEQTLRPDEIVVADGGSTDGTRAEVERYSDHGVRVRVLSLGEALPGRGRNAAIGAARNDWVALVDAGCTAAPTWLEELVRAIRETSSEAAMGSYEPLADNAWSEAFAQTIVAPRARPTGCRPPSVASLLMHRDAWRDAGRFPETLRAAEDLVFLSQVESRGLPSCRACGAIVYWSVPDSLGSAFEKLRQYSRWQAEAGRMGSWHVRVGAMHAIAITLLATLEPIAILLVVGATVARLLRSVAMRTNRFDTAALRPGRLGRAGLMLLAADLAMWAGLWDRVRGAASLPRARA